MTELTKRQVLIALAAVGAVTATGAAAQTCNPDFDFSGGKAIGEAWRAANPHADISALREQISPNGFCNETIERLQDQVAENFRTGEIFVYRGWRMSETEAWLFALLTE